MHPVFRAWIPSLNKMSDPFDLHDYQLSFQKGQFDSELVDMLDMHFETMQYIEKEDINKKPIFVDDIVKVKIYNEDETLRSEFVGVIEFEDGLFDAVQYTRQHGVQIWMGANAEENLVGTYITWEVLGDAHRNPELLALCIY